MNVIDLIEASNTLLKSLRLQYHYSTMYYISTYHVEIEPVCVCTDYVYKYNGWMYVCMYIVYMWWVLYNTDSVFMATLKHAGLSSVTWWYKNTINKNLLKLRPEGKTGVRKETRITDTADKAEVEISWASKTAQHHGSTVHGQLDGSFIFWTTAGEEITIFSITESYFQIRRMPALIFYFSKQENLVDYKKPPLPFQYMVFDV